MLDEYQKEQKVVPFLSYMYIKWWYNYKNYKFAFLTVYKHDNIKCIRCQWTDTNLTWKETAMTKSKITKRVYDGIKSWKLESNESNQIEIVWDYFKRGQCYTLPTLFSVIVLSGLFAMVIIPVTIYVWLVYCYVMTCLIVSWQSWPISMPGSREILQTVSSSISSLNIFSNFITSRH